LFYLSLEANFTYSFRAIFVLNGIPATNPQQKDVRFMQGYFDLFRNAKQAIDDFFNSLL